jgi:hypothetical protein
MGDDRHHADRADPDRRPAACDGSLGRDLDTVRTVRTANATHGVAKLTEALGNLAL